MCAPLTHAHWALHFECRGAPVVRRGDARVAPPCPTTSCVWRSLPYLTYLTSSSAAPAAPLLVLGACESVVALAPVGRSTSTEDPQNWSKKKASGWQLPKMQEDRGSGARPTPKKRTRPLGARWRLSPKTASSSEEEIEGTTATRIEVEHARASRWETAAVALWSRTWTRMDRRHAYLGDCHLCHLHLLGAAESRLAFAWARSP